MNVPGDLLKAYDERFRGRFGVAAPIVAGKDAKLAKTLLSRYEWPTLMQWLDDFFASEDTFIVQSTYSLGVFSSCLGKLIAARAPVARVVDEDAKARRARVEAETAARYERERLLTFPERRRA